MDYFLVSNSLQDRIAKCEILASLSSDHSPILLTFESPNPTTPGSNYWKFNSLLLHDIDFCRELEVVIENAKNEFVDLDPQTKWEIIKYKIRCFCIKFSKNIAKKKREKLDDLEKSIKDYENSPPNPSSYEIYIAKKMEFESLMDEKTNGYILRSKTQWYQYGENQVNFL